MINNFMIILGKSLATCWTLSIGHIFWFRPIPRWWCNSGPLKSKDPLIFRT